MACSRDPDDRPMQQPTTHENKENNMSNTPIPTTDSKTPTPVVFVHGLWLHASSWFPWIEAFAEAGYSGTAPTWPNEPDTVQAAREQPDSQAGTGIDDVVEHFTKLIVDMPNKP